MPVISGYWYADPIEPPRRGGKHRDKSKAKASRNARKRNRR